MTDTTRPRPLVPPENPVRPAILEDFRNPGQSAPEMGTALFAVLLSIGSFFRSEKALQAEVLALRHQVLVLRRQLGGRRIQLTEGDRILAFTRLSRLFVIGLNRAAWML